MALSIIGLVAEPASLTQTADSVVYLPFYSSTPVFLGMTFGVVFLFMIFKNIVKYSRYGVFNSNDFYSTHDTLKVGSLFVSVLAGELLLIGMMSFFYISQLTNEAGIC